MLPDYNVTSRIFFMAKVPCTHIIYNNDTKHVHTGMGFIVLKYYLQRKAETDDQLKHNLSDQ